MRSLTKIEVTHTQIALAFSTANLGEVRFVKEISDGWFNTVFEVAVDAGTKYIIKIAPRESVKLLTHENNLLATELDFYRIIKEHTDIKIPSIVFSDFTKKIIPSPYFIMEFLKGERLDKIKISTYEKSLVNSEIAYVFAKLHTISGEGYGYTQTGLKHTWKGALLHMVHMLIADSSAFGKRCKVGKKLISYINKFSYALEAVPSVLVNFDLHPMNIFATNENGKIELSIFDLERGFWGDPIGDFVAHEPFKSFHKKSIIKAYNSYAKTPINICKAHEIRYYLLLAYLGIIMQVERYSRFKGFKKFFSIAYILGTIGYLFFTKKALSNLKKLSK
ncbi:MAG: aminoglycoside phosphotransferase family protein [Firmicutes bacterium]|nr:aminoglycoside phosphotransferase family protein [Bacillota bacterium]